MEKKKGLLAVAGIIGINTIYGQNPKPQSSFPVNKLAETRSAEKPVLIDNPMTTNDESNDQPVGYYGTQTAEVCNDRTGTCYDLDVDTDGETVDTIYFPKGGHLNMSMSFCEENVCEASDEDSEDWTITLYNNL